MSSSRRWPWEAQQVHAHRREKQAQQDHRLRRWLTIFLPMGVGSVLVLLLMVWLVSGVDASVQSQAASIVVIFLTSACMLSGVVVFGVLLALIVGTHRLYAEVPSLARRLLNSLYTARQTLETIGDKATKPVVRWQVARAAARALWRKLRIGGQT